VGDQDRGYLLELLLTKLRYATAAVDDTVDGSCAGAIQIVGMSATLSNAADLAKWLCARLYQTDFRPVQLFKYIKVSSYTLCTCFLIWHRLAQ
jgi:DNA polymerase theta